jgi:hypothetical protein
LRSILSQVRQIVPLPFPVFAVSATQLCRFAATGYSCLTIAALADDALSG